MLPVLMGRWTSRPYAVRVVISRIPTAVGDDLKAVGVDLPPATQAPLRLAVSLGVATQRETADISMTTSCQRPLTREFHLSATSRRLPA